MYLSTYKMSECNFVKVTVDEPMSEAHPINVRFLRNEESGASDLYLCLSIEEADQLQAKLASALQELGRLKENHDAKDVV